jgi:hypothetical protein
VHVYGIYSEDTAGTGTYSVPSELELYTEDNYVDAFLFPIGWSRNGFFAFAGIGPLEGNDKYSVTYAVYNMVTDSCLWTFDDFGEYPEPHTAALSASWAKQQDTLDLVFSMFGIENRAVGKFTGFPFQFADDSVFAYVKLKREASCAGNPIAETELFVRSAERGTKRIAHNVYGCDAPGFNDRSAGVLEKYFIVGALISPFESRMAIISGVVSAYGETPRPATFTIHGAHLSTGFKK